MVFFVTSTKLMCIGRFTTRSIGEEVKSWDWDWDKTNEESIAVLQWGGSKEDQNGC